MDGPAPPPASARGGATLDTVQRWILSFVVVAAAVGAYLYATDRDTPAPKPTNPPPNRPLEETEIRQYLAIMSEIGAQYHKVGNAFEAERRRALKAGSTGAEAKALAQRASAGMWDPFLARHQVTLPQITALRARVEYVVDGIRDEQLWNTKAKKDLQAKLEEKRDLAERAGADTVLEKQIKKDMAALQRTIDTWAPPPIHPADRALVASFWADLDRVAPRRAPPPKKNG